MSSCKTVNMMLLRGMTAKRNVCIGVYSSMRGLQNCFDAGKLSVCATTRQSRLYQWMIGPHRSSAHQYVEHLSLPQLSRHRSFTTPLHCGSASPDQLSVYPLYPFFTVVRFRRRKMNRKPEASQEASADEEEETDDEDADDEVDISTIAFKEDALLTNNYRELTTHVKSARLDAVVSAGLGLPRNQVDEFFLASQLRLNGERLQKKSHKLGEGDYVDYVFTNEEGVTKLKRVRVIKIDDSGVASEKLKIYLRAWRSPQDP